MTLTAIFILNVQAGCHLNFCSNHVYLSDSDGLPPCLPALFAPLSVQVLSRVSWVGRDYDAELPAQSSCLFLISCFWACLSLFQNSRFHSLRCFHHCGGDVRLPFFTFAILLFSNSLSVSNQPLEVFQACLQDPIQYRNQRIPIPRVLFDHTYYREPSLKVFMFP